MPNVRSSCSGAWTDERAPGDPAVDGARFVHHMRPKGFPLLYRLRKPHPLRPAGFTAENYPGCEGRKFEDYVMIIRKELNFMRGWQEVGASLDTPCDDVARNQKDGWFRLEEGDMLWVRDKDGSNNPEDDALRFYFVSRSVLTKGQLQALTNLTKAVLGPKTERTAGRARKGPDGLWIGGTAYERDIRARPVRGTRCYTNAYSHQVAPNIVSPAPCLKIGDGPLDRGLKLRQLVNLTVPDIAADICEQTGPLGFAELFNKFGDLLSVPTVGNRLQHLFTNVQVNISPAAATSQDAKTFQESLGNFALPHTDNYDDGAALTAMALLPSVPKGYSMGIFAVHDLLSFIKPNGPSIVYFSGRHRHGGTAPAPPRGKDGRGSAYRLTVICYPNAATLRGTSRISLSVIPGAEVYNVPPELYWREELSTNRSSIVRDGQYIMGRKAWITAIARNNLLVSSNAFNHSSNHYGGGIDPKLYISSWYATEETTGERIYAEPWDSAPGSPGSYELWKRAVDECLERMEHLAMHTPGCFFAANKTGSKRKVIHSEDEDQDDDDDDCDEPGMRAVTGRPEQGGKQKRARQEEEGGNVMETQRHRMVLRDVGARADPIGPLNDDGEGGHEGPEQSTSRPSISQPSTSRPSTNRSSTNGSSTSRPSTNRSSTSQPSTNQPSTKQPSTSRPTTSLPPTSRPSTSEPSTDQLSMRQPSITFALFEDFDYRAIAKDLRVVQRPMFSRIRDGCKDVDTVLGVVTGESQQMQDILPIEQQEREAACAQQIRATWQALDHLNTNLGLQCADIRVCTAISLISLTDMWNWFDEQCTQPARQLLKLNVKHLLETPVEDLWPNSWIHPLVRDVRIQFLRSPKESPSVVLEARKYFILPDVQDYHGRRKRASGGQVAEMLLHVESAVIFWLKFPAETETRRETSQGIAAFITATHAVLKNYNFLYLDRVQQSIKKLRSCLTDQAISLSDIPWKTYTAELIKHPLAQEQSQETLALRRLVDHLHAISNRPSHPTPQMFADYQLALQTGGEQGVTQFIDSQLDLCL